MISRDWHRFWFALIAVALVAEGMALSRHREGDTLSEWTWSKISQFPLRMAVGGLLVWLIWHFLFSGPRRGLTQWDAVAVGVGLAVGFAAFRFGWR